MTHDAAEQSRLRSSIILTSTSSDSSLTSSSDDDDVNDGGDKKRRFKEKGKKFLTKKILDKSKSLTSLKKLEGQCRRLTRWSLVGVMFGSTGFESSAPYTIGLVSTHCLSENSRMYFLNGH